WGLGAGGWGLGAGGLGHGAFPLPPSPPLPFPHSPHSPLTDIRNHCQALEELTQIPSSKKT
ncbi:hypothetical protein QUB64_08350, partial [Microcoleus sp. Aus8_D2]